MFNAFSERMDVATRNRMLVSIGVAAIVLAGVLTGVGIAASNDDAPTAEPDPGPRADVTFVKDVPAPPPKKAAPEPAAAPAAPKPPPEIAKVTPPPQPKPTPKPKPTPTNMTTKPPPEKPGPIEPATATAEPATKVYGTGDLDATGTNPSGNGTADGTATGTGTGDGDATGGGGGGAVILPPGATPASPIGVLITADDYPRAMRSANIEGTVIVKVIIQVDGTVDIVKFIKSDPNFDDAVKAILKRVRYRPAVYNGQPIAVYQNIRFPFTIDDE